MGMRRKRAGVRTMVGHNLDDGDTECVLAYSSDRAMEKPAPCSYGAWRMTDETGEPMQRFLREEL
jgi:hypothetical protein